MHGLVGVVNVAAGNGATVTRPWRTTGGGVVGDVTTTVAPAGDDVNTTFSTTTPSERSDSTIAYSIVANVTSSLTPASVTPGSFRILSFSAEKLKLTHTSRLI